MSELRDSARRVLNAAGLPASKDKVWPLIIELGWQLVIVPEDLGGLGQGLAEACVLHRELGASVADAPFLPAMLGLDAICRSDAATREVWIESITAGFCVTVPLANSAVALGKTLSGMASGVPSADQATHVLVYGADQNCLALVPLAEPGIEILHRPTWDRTRRLFDVRFNDVTPDDEFILARGPAAQSLIRRLLAHRDFALAADSVGGAAALLEMTVDYLQTRRQFGRPLALFQALKHRCADLKVQSEAADALLQDSLDRLGEANESEAELLGKQAKSFASFAYSRIVEEAIQLHGGIGMTAEHPCHYFLKRAMLNAQLGRPNESYELDIAASILEA